MKVGMRKAAEITEKYLRREIRKDEKYRRVLSRKQWGKRAK